METLLIEGVEMEKFQMTWRDWENRTYMEDGTWGQMVFLKWDPRVLTWEIRRHVNGRWVMIAQAKNYHSVPAATAMRRTGQAAPEQQVVDGLLVDIQFERTYIYFREMINPFDSCLKIYNGTHISIEGGVTLENYEGFIKAAALAKTYLRPIL